MPLRFVILDQRLKPKTNVISGLSKYFLCVCENLCIIIEVIVPLHSLDIFFGAPGQTPAVFWSLIRCLIVYYDVQL